MNPDETHPPRPRPARPFALAAAVGLAVAALWWADHRAARQRADALQTQLDDANRAATERDQQAATRETEVALDRWEEALRAEDTERAAEILTRFERPLNRPVPDGGDARAGQCLLDLWVLRDLDRAAGAAACVAFGAIPAADGNVKERLAAAVRAVGINPGEMSAADAAAKVKASAVRERLVSALDSWHVLDATGEGREKAAILAVLWEADPNDFRNEVRAAVHAGRLDRVLSLLGEPDAVSQPAGFVVAMGRHAPPDVLRAARTRHPNNLPVLLALAARHPTDAVRWAQAAVAARPRSGVAWMALGLAQWRAGETDEAVVAFRQATRFDRDLPVPHFALGCIRYRSGDPAGAVRALAEAVRLAPDMAVAANELAWVMATHPDEKWRNGRRAVELAQRACYRTMWKVAEYVETLAAAHAEAGDFDKAAEVQGKALSVGGVKGDAPARLALYQRKQPFRQSHPVTAPAPRSK